MAAMTVIILVRKGSNTQEQNSEGDMAALPSRGSSEIETNNHLSSEVVLSMILLAVLNVAPLLFIGVMCIYRETLRQ